LDDLVTFEFTAQKLVYGGDALGHYHGRTVLVPRALPGERVEVEEVRTAKGVTHARPLRVIAAAPERVAPPCPYFGRCGGCQYQHLNYQSQSAWKREILRETLRRIGKISWESDIRLHTGDPWNYRNQAQIKVSRSGGRAELGFYEAESHHLIPVDQCAILSPRLNLALGALRGEAWSESLTECREIEMLVDDQDEKMMVTIRGNFTAPRAEALARQCLEGLPGVRCVAIERSSGFSVYGEPGLDYRVGEFHYRISPGSFFQASRYLLSEMVAEVTGGQSGSLAIDLYAGVGLFTLPLAQGFQQVVGVEGNQPAAGDLESNARHHELKNLRVVSESAYDFLRRFAQAEPDLAVLDPPRAGVGAPTLELLGRLGPARLHYVSCHPPTLARDLANLTHLGYRLISVEMFDFFPQTAHIECLTQLTRSDRADS
jgi:23S rRNA (uracil1939-C5)-methyltransferase